MEVPCTHTSHLPNRLDLVRAAGAMPATGFLVVRISAACMALACGKWHVAIAGELRRSRSRPGSVCFRVRTNVLVHRVEHFCALRLAMLSSRVQTFQLRVRQHPTNKSTHVLMEDCEEPHLLTDSTALGGACTGGKLTSSCPRHPH